MTSDAPIATGIGPVTEKVTRLMGMRRDEFFNTYFTGQKELAVMSAMKPTERAQFLSRVLGYERLRIGQDRLRLEKAVLRARLDTLRSGLPDPVVLQEAVTSATERCSVMAAAGQGRAGAGAEVSTGTTRNSGPAGPPRRSSARRPPRSIRSSASPSATWRRPAGTGPDRDRAAGGCGGGGARGRAGIPAQAPASTARGSGVAHAGRRGQQPARGHGRPAQGDRAAPQGAREAPREGAWRGPARKHHERPQYRARGARLHPPVARGTAHALGTGHAGSQDEARGAPRPVQGSRGAAEADRECRCGRRVPDLRPPAPQGVRIGARCARTGRPRR